MVKYAVFVLLAIICHFGTGNTAVVAGGDNLEYIGKFTPQRPKLDGEEPASPGDGAAQQTSQYFRSQNSAAYATASNDCENAGGTLLNIETTEELKAVEGFLTSTDDTGSSYWVGGKFDRSSAGFVWSTNAKIESWLPWDNGHPTSRLPITRVAAFIMPGEPLKIRTFFQTVSNRYLCEFKG